MLTSESEGPRTHKSLTHLGKLIQAWVYIQKHPKQWNSTVEYPNVKNKLPNKKILKKMLLVNLPTN